MKCIYFFVESGLDLLPILIRSESNNNALRINFKNALTLFSNSFVFLIGFIFTPSTAVIKMKININGNNINFIV